MTNEIENFKGEKMLKRADELNFFWAYNKEELSKDNQRY